MEVGRRGGRINACWWDPGTCHRKGGNEKGKERGGKGEGEEKMVERGRKGSDWPHEVALSLFFFFFFSTSESKLIFSFSDELDGI